MSGHQPPAGRSAFAEADPGGRGGVGADPLARGQARSWAAGRRLALHTGRQQPAATAASRGPRTRRSAHHPTHCNQQRTLPIAAAGRRPAQACRRGRDTRAPAATTPTLIVGVKEPIMRTPTLWQIDMGDGTWAMSCRSCRLSYRGPKAGADLLFDTHQCEPVVPLRAQTR